mmetsp:Transcript_77734/g.140259  ORF Transcript_77734/g.140259 Transcript_77734/m.140259 type:complete len:368 (-) Transcript_77734:131-1234(-)
MADVREARGEELSRRELERQIQDLRRDKVRIDDNLRRMEANKNRIFGEAEAEAEAKRGGRLVAKHSIAAQDDGDNNEEDDEDKVEKKAKAEQEDKDDGDKEEKKDDDKDKEDGDEDDDSKKRKRDEDEEEKEEKKKKDTRPSKADPRSRNLFGKLLGHLHSAKDRLTKEKSTKMSELQQKALSRVEEKVGLTRMNIKEFRKGQFSTSMAEESEKLKEIEKTIAEKELVLLQLRLESHYSLMMNFIRTKAQPTIFFLPAKHTRDTEKLLEETRSAIKHKIASLKVQLQQTEEDADPEEAMRAKAAAAAEAAAEGVEPASAMTAKAEDTGVAAEDEGEAQVKPDAEDVPESKKRKVEKEKKEDSESEDS